MKPHDTVDWVVTALFWMLASIITALLCGIGDARAAKIQVTWLPVTKNTDGSTLTNLAGYRIEWGSCNSDTSFGIYQAGLNAPAAATSAWIYPTGLNPVCVRIYTYTLNSLLSAPAYAFGPAPPLLSKPVTK